MSVATIADRESLGALWLPWCVERDARHRIIPADQISTRVEDAMQLCVSDIDDPDVRRALRNNESRGSTIADVSSIALTLNQAARLVRIVIPRRDEDVLTRPALFTLPEGRMLHEACHRCCGVYESGVAEFEIEFDVAALPEAPSDWNKYSDHRLRAR